MRLSHIPIEDYMEAIQTGHWFTRHQLELWVTGEEHTRHGRTEKVLAKLKRERRVTVWNYHGKNVYAAKRRTKFSPPTDSEFSDDERRAYLEEKYAIDHGLACTEAMLRCRLSSPDGTDLLAEHEFFGSGAVPDFGVRFPSKSLILGEYSSRDQSLRTAIIINKVRSYDANLDRIREEKAGDGTRVLFICDVSRDYLERTLRGRWYHLFTAYREGHDVSPYFFCSATEFFAVPYGRQLQEAIYLWSEDIKPYPLVKPVEHVVFQST